MIRASQFKAFSYGTPKRPPPRDEAILKLIKDGIAATGVCPSYREMAKGVGLKAQGSVISRAVERLEAAGKLRRLPNRARAIEVVPDQPTPSAQLLPKPLAHYPKARYFVWDADAKALVAM